ncbi:hypothetical protein FACS1894137_10220 [Spirochaetia bacterium]|nr:hypothetical protein FACS1894137_10220 [Spirochaetia bacterium]
MRISYEDAMNYFLANKNNHAEIVKGIILKEPEGNYFFITQTFLDKNNAVVQDESGNPLGYKIKVTGIDSELSRLFKEGDLILVE